MAEVIILFVTLVLWYVTVGQGSWLVSGSQYVIERKKKNQKLKFPPNVWVDIKNQDS